MPPPPTSRSAGRNSATLYTESREWLPDAIGLRNGSQFGAIDQVMGKEQRGGIERLPRAVGIGLG